MGFMFSRQHAPRQRLSSSQKQRQIRASKLRARWRRRWQAARNGAGPVPSPPYTEFIEPPPPLSPSRGCVFGIDPANRDYTGVDLLMEPHFEKALPDDARTAHFKKPTSAATPSLPPHLAATRVTHLELTEARGCCARPRRGPRCALRPPRGCGRRGRRARTA